MRAVIIGNGNISDNEYILSKIKNDDYIICADGGYNNAQKMGLKADVLIGDLDSALNVCDDIKIIKYPAKKNFTDGELCIEYAIENGYDDTLLLGMTSHRIDHTINNILMMCGCKNACMIDEYNEIYLVKDKLEKENKKGYTLSIIPINGDAEGIVTTGLEYPLCYETLQFGKCRGNSNVINADFCKISIEKGMCIVVISNGE